MIEEGRALIIALNKWDVAEHASSLFNGVKAALVEGLGAAEGRASAHRLRQDRQGHRHRPRVSLSTCATRGRGACPRASSTAGSRPRSRPTRRRRRAGQRIKLRYITQVKIAAADLRRIRQPHRRASRELPALSGQCPAPRPQARPGPAAARLSRPRQSLRSRQALRRRLPFSRLSLRPVGPRPEAPGA